MHTIPKKGHGPNRLLARMGCVILAVTLWATAASAGNLSYNATTFTERWQNDGGIANTLTVTLANDAFTGAIGVDFITNRQWQVVSAPDGWGCLLRSAGAVTNKP